ncbi:hypothetical protein DVH24_017870 [Malus domestica]|uniref:TIR domain-containing protein n=1 Tax=Malus domestica TaxID=3750 RepID=A0A498KE12_MALDO|nr:hypothetical protein DVH24_017870 [Malus domestica]
MFCQYSMMLKLQKSGSKKKHEENIRKEDDDKKGEAKRESVEQWRKALAEAANLSGYDLKNTENG